MDNAKLKAIERHIEFSFHQIGYTADLIMERQQSYREGKLAKGEWSAYVESFAIHARLLVFFFYRARQKASDVIASDFVVDWERRRPQETEQLKEVVVRVNKQIAHMTINRTEYDLAAYEWNVGKIVNEISRCRGLFTQLCRDAGQFQFANSPQSQSGWPHNLTGRTS